MLPMIVLDNLIDLSNMQKLVAARRNQNQEEKFKDCSEKISVCQGRTFPHT